MGAGEIRLAYSTYHKTDVAGNAQIPTSTPGYVHSLSAFQRRPVPLLLPA